MQAGVLNQGPELRRNLTANPSFESGTIAGWTLSSAGAGSGISTEWVHSGSKSLKGFGTGAVSGDVRLAGGTATTFPSGILAGKTYRISAYTYCPVDINRNHRSRRILCFYSINGSTFTENFGIQGAATAGVERVSQTFSIPANATGVIIGVGFASAIAGQITYVDDVLIEETASLGTYFDGSTAATAAVRYEWAGTPNASASIQRQVLSSDVHAFTTRILVNGVARPALSWSVDRDIVSDLPEQVIAGSGVAHATGNVEWAAAADVTDGSLNPWNPSTGWIPMEGDSVEIWAGDGTTEWRQFVGVIDTSAGTINGGFASKIIDRIDDLSGRANLPSLIDVMPPITPTGDFRRFRLTPRWAIMEALRRAGFYATPATEAHTVVDVPAFSGMWPHIGEMLTCTRGTNTAMAPLWPNGTHVADLNSEYTPKDPRTGTQPVQLTMNIAAAHAGVTSLQVLYGASNIILRATTANVLFIVNGVTVCNVPRSGNVVAQVLFSGGTARLRTSAGQDVSGTATWSVPGLNTSVKIVADTSSLANGFIVSHPQQPWHEFANIAWTATANIVSGTMHGTMAALRGTRDQSVRDVLTDAAGALLWPHWIDETGVMQVIQSDVLRGRAPVQTVTTLDDIRSLEWERSLLGIRSQIVMSFDRVTINRRKDYSLPVIESTDSVVLKSGEEHVTFLDPGSDEWIMLDTSPSGVDDTANINAGIGTWVGGIYTDGVTQQWTNQVGTQLTTVMSEVGDGRWKVTHTAGTLTAGWQVELRTVSGDFMGSTTLWPYWWEKNLPIARAKGNFTTTTVTRDPSIVGSRGPSLEHSCGTWATGNTDATETTVVDAIANFLSGQVVTPNPTITSLRVGFDPRRQLGDVITISSPDFMGVELKCLIVGVQNAAGRSFEQSLAVRVISVETTFTTWAEWESAWGPTADYTALEAAWGATATYTDFNNDPLRGTA